MGLLYLYFKFLEPYVPRYALMGLLYLYPNFLEPYGQRQN